MKRFRGNNLQHWNDFSRQIAENSALGIGSSAEENNVTLLSYALKASYWNSG
jgi:hypothetical protein